MRLRKCCGTPTGKAPHKIHCLHYQPTAPSPWVDVPKEGRRAVLEDVGADLPDGAFFALAEELGLEPEDLT